MDLQGVNNNRFVVDNYQFDISFEEGVLTFHVRCPNTFTKYTAIIDNQTIKRNKNIEFFFATPQDLYAYLIGGCTNSLHLKEGAIHFSIETKLGKSIKTYQCLIETVKEELMPETVLELKFERLDREFSILKIENGRLKQKILQQQLEMGQIRQEVEKCQKELSRKDQIITKIFKDLEEFNKWKNQRESFFSSFNNTLLKKFIPDQTNPHNKKFIQLGNRYRKNCGGTWDVLISKMPIQKNIVSKYNIKQIKAGSNGSFMYGIGTEAIKGLSRPQDSKDFIGYYQNTGFIYDQSESMKGGQKIKDGDIITIQVDTQRWKIFWLINSKKEAETTISFDLRAKNIYLAIVVFNEQSEIEFV